MGLLDRLFSPLSPQRFARKILRALQSAGFAEASLMPDEFGITVSRDGYRLFLDNLYREYAAAPWSQRGAVLRRCIEFARSSRESRDDEPELHACRENLLPRIRERFYHEAIRLQFALQGASEADFPTLRFSHDLTVELVIDQPQTIQVVHGSLLRKWGMSLEEALKIARGNLWRRSIKDEQGWGVRTLVKWVTSRAESR